MLMVSMSICILQKDDRGTLVLTTFLLGLRRTVIKLLFIF